jgi:hypothetical protein
MGLRHETQEDLRSELERLERRIRAIREILGEEERHGGVSAAGHAPSVKAAAPQNGAAVIRSGLRKWLRDTVTASPGLRPAGITKKLEEGGFQGGGTTQLSIRVSNELRRMAKVGQLKKRGSKYYPLEGGESHAAT